MFSATPCKLCMADTRRASAAWRCRLTAALRPCRRLSNRDSARRTRMRKARELDAFREQVSLHCILMVHWHSWSISFSTLHQFDALAQLEHLLLYTVSV